MFVCTVPSPSHSDDCPSCRPTNSVKALRVSTTSMKKEFLKAWNSMIFKSLIVTQHRILKTSLPSTESCALINSAMFLDEVLEVLERWPEHNVPMRPLGHVGQQRTVLQAHQCVITSDVTQHTGTPLLALILRTTITNPCNNQQP